MCDYENCSEEMLVKRARHGDKQAFARLYEGIYIELYRFACYTLRCPEDARDVVSESVISAYEHIGKLKKSEAFRSWIFTIVSNKCKKKMMSYKTESLELVDNEAAVTPDLAQNLDLHNALQRISKEERLIVVMIALLGYNSKETGEILKLNSNTVRSKFSRALEKMKQF